MKLRNDKANRTIHKRFDFEKLEDRNMLTGFGELVHVDLTSNTDDLVPLVVAGDPNGTPPVTPDDLIDPNIAASPFAGVVAINPNGNNVCSGSLISPTHILTAGHCVDFDDNGIADISLTATEVHFNHQDTEIVYTGIANATAHPDYTGFANPAINDDVAILTLNAPAPAGVPIYPLVTDAYVNPTRIFMVGYGTTGDAINGYQPGSANHDIKRVGENLAGGFEVDDEGNGLNEIFVIDFDGPDATTDTLTDGLTFGNDIEVTIGGGDSGGPSFVWNDLNNDLQVTADELVQFGVNTYGRNVPVQTPGFGSQGGGMAVASYMDWLGQFISSGEAVVSVNGTTIADGGSYDFGVTKLGNDINRVFTVTNTDVTPLTLEEPISVPGEYIVVSSFGQLVLDQGESTTFEVSFNANANGGFVGQLSFNNSDRDQSPFNFTVTATVTTAIGEAAVITVDGTWQTVNLDNTYFDPVIVAGPVTSNDADPATVRIRNVTSDSFQIRIQEWQYQTGKHQAESISYVVMETGVHRLSNGMTLIAGNTDGVTHKFKGVVFEIPFDETPVVLTQPISVNGGAPITPRVFGVGTHSFQVLVQEEEGGDRKHNPETVSFLAFVPTEGELGQLEFTSEVTERIVDEKVETLPLGGSFTAPPVFLANMQSYHGSNTANLRVTELTNTNVSLFVQEEQSRDQETGHGFESVGFLAVEEGEILGRTIIGESGVVNHLTRDWTTINLAQDYLDPVVIFSVNSQNEEDPTTIRVRNVTSNSFQVHFEEWNYQNLNHRPERVSYVVFESGIHRLRDGTIIEARNTKADTPWSNVGFSRDNAGVTPVVFSQVITDNGPATVVTRHKSVASDGFDLRLQEEDGADGGHNVETVSWIAVHEGSGNSNGLRYEAQKKTGVTDAVSTIALTNSYAVRPVVIGNMQTTNDTEAALVRGVDVTLTNVKLFVQEDQSMDKETSHEPEVVGLFALSAGIIDGFILDLFDSPTSPLLGFSASVFPSNDSVDNNSIQQMLANEDDGVIKDSVFEAFDVGELVHVDILESEVVAFAGMASMSARADNTFHIRSGETGNEDESRESGELFDNPFRSL